MSNQIIEVPDISVVKTSSGTKQLLSLRDQKIMKEKVLVDMGAGSGIKYEGDLYVLGAVDEPIVTMTTMKANPFLRTTKKDVITVDWGDGVVEKNDFSHTYADGVQSHDIKLYGSTDAILGLAYNDNQLTSLEVSKNTALTILACSNNQLTNLDASKNTILTKLRCDNNQLTSLNVGKNTTLTVLWCNSNQLTNLDISNNTAITSLDCRDNQLTGLDVSKNTALAALWCDNNQLINLDVSNNTALSDLYCHNNQLTGLDVSKNTALQRLDCYANPLVTDQPILIALAKSLPDRTGKSTGVFHILNVTSVAWVKNICDAKNWTVA